MSPERWRRVEEIFEAALALSQSEREIFLAESCGEDAELRDQIEAMLEADAERGDSLESGAAGLGAAVLLEGFGETDRNIGRRVGKYRIVREIGRGGMGAVYEAVRDDDEFRQHVAIKLIKRGMDTDFILRRFRHERQILANLNHPFIARLLDGGTTEDGLPYFVMELVEGERIDRFCERRSLNLRQRLALFGKVCAAVAHAHQRGVAHRDIKPGNILVTADGEIKLLDFGIAKLLTADNSPDTIDAMTARLMTPDFASPEQIRGQSVTPASDVYSLGVLLYQLLTGKHPYKKANLAPHELARAVCEENPVRPSSVLRLRRQEEASDQSPSNEDEIPPGSDRIVLKALRKKPDERYQTAGELGGDINRILGGEPISAEEFPVPETGDFQPQISTDFAEAPTVFMRRRPWQSSALILCFLILLAVGGATAFWFYQKAGEKAPEQSPTNLLTTAQVTRLTSHGQAYVAAVSPDGTKIAYVVNENGRRSIWLKSKANPRPVRIVPESEARLGWLSFSPDGNEVFYLYRDNVSDFGSILRVAATGGESRKFLDDVASRISFAADGNRFVFIRDRRGRGESALLVADSSGNPPQPITLLRYPDHIAAAEWSPDGKTIAYCTVETLENKEQAGMIYLYSVETGVTRRLGDKYWGYLTNIVWQPDGTAVFLNGQNDPKSNIQIWRVRLADATAERVTNNANDYRGLSAARNSNTLVTVKTEMHCGISVAALNKSTATAEGNASPIVETNLPGLSGLDWTPDGKIIYTTLENSVFSLWRIDSDGSNQTQLLGNELDRVLPDVSLDNRYIVYAAGAIESKHIWRVNTDGTSEIQLTDGEDEKVPQITPDGKWVVFAQITAGKPTLAKIPIEGGKIVQLSEMEAQYPVVSPDGRTIAFLLMEPTLGRIALMSIEGGAPTKIFPEPISFAGKPFFSMLLRFSPDGQSINFIKNEKGVSNLFAQPLDGKPVKKITNFSTGEIFYFDFSPDGSRLALARGSQTSDVLQINLPN